MTMKTCVEQPDSLDTILVRLLSYASAVSVYARTGGLSIWDIIWSLSS